MKNVGVVLAALVGFTAAVAAANDLSRDEDVVLFPTYVVVDGAADVTSVPLHGWIYEPEDDSRWRGDVVDRLAIGITLTEQELASPLFRQRARMFLVDNERNQRLVATVAGREVRLTASEADGHFHSVVKLSTAGIFQAAQPAGDVDSVLRYQLETPRGDARTFVGRVHILRPQGWSVVSDIDDTIKASNVLDKHELMRNTFLRKFKAVDGMASTYAAWAREGAAVHYVSGSPWQLYASLADFADDAGFPEGTFHLRHFRLQDGSAKQLLQPPQAFKIAAISEILRASPGRKFVFVGDSGEQDPEVYGELARRYPEQVRLIAIRNITRETLDNARLKAAWAEVPANRRLLFEEADELPDWDELTKP